MKIGKVATRHKLVELIIEGVWAAAHYNEDVEITHSLVRRLHKDGWLTKGDVKLIKSQIKTAYLRYHLDVDSAQYDYMFANIIKK